MTVSIVMNDGQLRELGARVRSWSQVVPRATAEMAGRVAPLLLRAARAAVPVGKDRPGHTHLRDTMQVRTLRVGANVQLQLGYHWIGKLLITGSRPHEIRPRNPGGVLRFEVGGGQVVFARVVHHPGTKPNDWRQEVRRTLRPQLQAVGRETVRIYARKLKEAS